MLLNNAKTSLKGLVYYKSLIQQLIESISFHMKHKVSSKLQRLLQLHIIEQISSP